jgi:Flp pilus assembly pilin Flp
MFSDEGAQGTMEYALVAVTFAVMMFILLTAVQTGTGSNLNTTQNNLTNLYKASPAP